MISGLEDEDRDQHEQAAEHGEQDELHRRVDAPAPAPDADEEIHRDEHGLPEDIEQEEVQGDEDADHAGLEQQHEHGEFLDPVVDRAPGGEEGQRRQESGQEDEEQADAVDADVIIEAAPEPESPLDEFERSRGPVETGQEHQGGEERQQRCPQGQGPDGLDRSALDEQEQDGSGQGQEGDDGQDGSVGGEGVHISRNPRKRMAPSRKARA